MNRAVFSPYWYRVADLRPCLRPHVRVDRQYLRDQLWYVIEDGASNRHYRFTPAAYDLIGAMDGSATVQAIWERAVARRGEEAPTQEEALAILATLFDRDLMRCDIAPDVANLFARFQSHRQALARHRLDSPLFMRLSLLDPDRMLDRMAPALRALFTPLALSIWFVTVMAGLLTGAVNWSALSENIVDRALSPTNLLLLSLIFPCIKLLHELGHAAATKVRGGQVHDMGLILVAFIPMPYVDCSAASMFRHGSHRIVVGAAGMMVELFLGALAMFVWANTEPGLLHAAAFNVILIAGISTVIINGNPLLRYDAYYMLADLVGIPNLATRATRYYGYLCRRYLLGAHSLECPASAPGERVWFVSYGLLSLVNRTVITIALIWALSGRYFFLGMLLAAWAFIAMLVLPTWRTLVSIANTPDLHGQRGRAFAVILLLTGLPAAMLFGLSVPLTTIADGVVVSPDGAELRTGADATIVRMHVRDGAHVEVGDIILETEDPYLDSQTRLCEARVHASRARLDAAGNKQVERELARQALGLAEAELNRAREQAANLILRAQTAGTVVIPRQDQLPGRFVSKGELVGYILGDEPALARVIVPQERIGLVRESTLSVALRTASQVERVLPATIQESTPGATSRLPSAALGTQSGGSLPTDPNDKDGTLLIRPAFQFDLRLPISAHESHIGERVYVRFEHGAEPLGWQWYRMARQLFLGKFQA